MNVCILTIILFVCCILKLTTIWSTRNKEKMSKFSVRVLFLAAVLVSCELACLSIRCRRYIHSTVSDVLPETLAQQNSCHCHYRWHWISQSQSPAPLRLLSLSELRQRMTDCGLIRLRCMRHWLSTYQKQNYIQIESFPRNYLDDINLFIRVNAKCENYWKNLKSHSVSSLFILLKNEYFCYVCFFRDFPYVS